LTAGYSPRLEGIYILSPETQTQTRLFDYIDGVGEEDRVEAYDIDRDEDKDYLFLLEGALYIKYTTTKNPGHVVDMNRVIKDLDLNFIPKAPNYFHESVMSPGQIDISFTPESSTSDNFRLEFFDKYLEWDVVQMLGTDDSDTPRVIVDMTVQAPSRSSTGIIQLSVDRSLEEVSAPDGFILEGMKVVTLRAGQSFTLASGRPLYTGNQDVELDVRYASQTGSTRVSVERFMQSTFPEDISVTIRSGKIYILTPSGTEKISYTEDMRGMPLLPGIRILHSQGSVSIYEPKRSTSTVILPGSEYRHISLGPPARSYTSTITFPNGFYSARLRSLKDNSIVRAGVTLLAPQASLDRSPPVLELPSSIRIPVYQSQKYLLSDIVTDMSAYSFLIDPDITQDENANTFFEDDFTSTGIGMNIDNESVSFGPFDALGTRTMYIQIQDEYGNTTRESLDIEVYAPVPQIQTLSAT
jgi:hypothetical protein